ncbi:MAG TPA: neutral zinc metallopeptidase [Gemmatimonadaceae bacterium]|nr:neutral zinc metallopeptidase [Gemmatimonadaceae bacterium]
MRWTPGGESRDIEDRRGSSRGAFGGRGIHVGIGGAILLLVLSLVFHRDFFSLVEGGAGTGTVATADSGAVAPVTSTPEEDRLVQFVSFVLDDDQKTWERLEPADFGTPYRHAKLVLFRDATETACGEGEAATGPFYCPEDERVYIDLGFYEELRQRFGAPGDFAQAYVIAHELGHHVQKLAGIEGRAQRAMQADPEGANAVSVRLELQADCYAGVWGHSAAQRNLLDPGDAQEGLDAAAAVGDDRLQRMSTGHVQADAFTHGSSAQRMAWFKRGFDSGDPRACDTFATRTP